MTGNMHHMSIMIHMHFLLLDTLFNHYSRELQVIEFLLRGMHVCVCDTNSYVCACD
jgi:hypothetical protein